MTREPPVVTMAHPARLWLGESKCHTRVMPVKTPFLDIPAWPIGSLSPSPTLPTQTSLSCLAITKTVETTFNTILSLYQNGLGDSISSCSSASYPFFR